MEYEVWAGRYENGSVGYICIPATEEKREEMRRATPEAMREVIATFTARNWDEASATYQDMYETLATEWEARNP